MICKDASKSLSYFEIYVFFESTEREYFLFFQAIGLSFFDNSLNFQIPIPLNIY